MANFEENISGENISSMADELLRGLDEQWKTDKLAEGMKKGEIDIATMDEELTKKLTNDDTQIDMRTLSDDEFKELFDNYLTSAGLSANIDESDYSELHRHVVNLQQKSGAELTSEMFVPNIASNNDDVPNSVYEETYPEEKLGEKGLSEEAYDGAGSEGKEIEIIEERPKKESKISIFARLRALLRAGEKREAQMLEEEQERKPEESGAFDYERKSAEASYMEMNTDELRRASENIAVEKEGDEPVEDEKAYDDINIIDDALAGESADKEFDEDSSEITYIDDGTSAESIGAITGDDISETEQMLEKPVDDTDVLSTFAPNTLSDDEAMMTDTAMMKAFGLDPKKDLDTAENEIESFEQRMLDENGIKAAPDRENQNGKKVSAEMADQGEARPQKKDYSSFDQNKEVFASYKKKYAAAKIKLILCALFAIVLLVIENIGIFGVELPYFMQSSMGYASIEWIFLFFTAILVCDRMIDSAKKLASFEFDADSLTLITFFMSVVMSVVALVVDTEGVKMWGLPFALLVFVNLWGSYIGIRKEIFTFKILSSQKKKRALTLAEGSEKLPESEAFAEYLSEDSAVYKIAEADFVDGYFRRKDVKPASYKRLRVLYPAIFGIAVIFAALSAIVMKTGIYESFANGYMTFIVCAPITAFIANELPLYLSSIRAYRNSAAIIGDAAPEMLRNMSVMAFSDNDIFDADGVMIKGVKIIENNKIENIIYYAASALSLVEGPLARLFKQATLDGKISDEVTLRVLSDNGIDAMIDGKHIVIGTPSYMEAQCFETIYEQNDEYCQGKSNKRILYLACDEEMIAKFYVEYNVSSDFIYLVKRLAESGICVSVRTNDPCLDAEALCRGKFAPENYPVKVIKGEKREASDLRVAAAKTGVIGTGTVKGFVKTALLCDRINSVSRTNFVIKAISVGIGAVAMGFLISSGLTAGLWSLYPALFQAFWLIPIYLISRVYI